MLASGEGWASARDNLLTDFFLKARGSGENAQLDVYHSQVRESVVEGMSDEAYRDANRQLATHLERDGGADPERLHGYFLAAGQDTKAGQYAAIAAGAAESALAFQRAADLYRSALALTPGPRMTEDN